MKIETNFFVSLVQQYFYKNFKFTIRASLVFPFLL